MDNSDYISRKLQEVSERLQGIYEDDDEAPSTFGSGMRRKKRKLDQKKIK